MAHLVQGRIESLERLAKVGTASRFSHSMAYTLFANNLVDYADKYRGMQAVVMNEFEAFADVTLKQVQSGGIYTVPPYFIDSVAHLAGFIMNVSDVSDTANTFCVTPGWNSMRFARPLLPGQRYRSYVKMIPANDDPSVYLGDVYILQEGVVMGMVGGIKFRRYPRILLSRFFSAPDSAATKSQSTVFAPPMPASKPSPAPVAPPEIAQLPPRAAPAATPQSLPAITKVTQPPAPSTAAADMVEDRDSTAYKALELIAKEGGLDMLDLSDDAAFANLGVDSLMSLVIAEKFREDLGIVVEAVCSSSIPRSGS